MKHSIIISALTLLLLSGCAAQTPNEEIETTTVDSGLVQLDGINFEAPINYQYLFEHTPFTSFEAYADDIEKNLIKDLIQSNQQGQLTESEVESELEQFEGRYSFERTEVNDFDVLVHRRDFFGMIGNIYRVYIYVGNGYILSFSDELNHEKLNEVLSTIQK